MTEQRLRDCSTPAYDYAPNPDKQWILQVTDRMEPIHKKFTDLLMTKRLQTLQSVDTAIERVSHFLAFCCVLNNNNKLFPPSFKWCNLKNGWSSQARVASLA